MIQRSGLLSLARAIGLLAVFCLFLYGIWAATGMFFVDLDTHLQVFSVVTNAALTAGLLLIYSDMIGLNQRQTRVMEAEMEPVIETPDYEVDGDELEVKASNYGDGLATNLELVTVVDFTPSGGFSPKTVSIPFYQFDEEGNRVSDQSIKPHQERVKFRGEPQFGVETNGEVLRYGNFSTAMSNLANRAEIDDFVFGIFLRYENSLGEQGVTQVFTHPRQVGEVEPMDFEEAYNRGGIFSPEILERDFTARVETN